MNSSRRLLPIDHSCGLRLMPRTPERSAGTRTNTNSADRFLDVALLRNRTAETLKAASLRLAGAREVRAWGLTWPAAPIAVKITLTSEVSCLVIVWVDSKHAIQPPALSAE
jgi:hypothetical protein